MCADSAGEESIIKCHALTFLFIQLNPVASDFAMAGFGILENAIRTGQVDLTRAIEKSKGDVKTSIEKAKDCADPHIQAAKTWGLACSKLHMAIASSTIMCRINVKVVRRWYITLNDQGTRASLLYDVLSCKW